MAWLLVCVLGYLIGSIPAGYLVTRRVAGVDVRRVGSGNVGATNVLRATTLPMAALVLAIDTAKGALAAYSGWWLGGPVAAGALAAACAVLGHVHPVWLRFAGGKGVATGAGGFLVLAPATAGGAVAAFLIVVWRTRFVSLGSITAAVLLPVLAFALDDPAPVASAAVAVSLLVLWRHRENIVRLRHGIERKL